MVSHMDPRLSKGGAEIAAFQLYDQLLSTGDIEGWFLSAAPNKLERRDGVVFAQPFDARSYIYAGGRFDHFLHANMDAPFFEHARRLFREIEPDIVHFHHYTNFGVELLGIVKEVAPNAKIVLTLHEFLAICHHYGQMVKRDSLALQEAPRGTAVSLQSSPDLRRHKDIAADRRRDGGVMPSSNRRSHDRCTGAGHHTQQHLAQEETQGR
jgi:hypothetical protein